MIIGNMENKEETIQGILDEYFYHDKNRDKYKSYEYRNKVVEHYSYRSNYWVRKIDGVYRLEVVKEFSEDGYSYSFLSIINNASQLRKLLNLIVTETGESIALKE